MDEKIVTRIGWFASLMGVALWFSYIDQIKLNLSGNPGSIIVAVVTIINCCAWVAYGSLKPVKDWPIILANVPGIILGAISAFTIVF